MTCQPSRCHEAGNLGENEPEGPVALERLDPQKAEFVAQRHLAGVPTADIAERAGVSERSVRRSLSFARAFIRREVAG